MQLCMNISEEQMINGVIKSLGVLKKSRVNDEYRERALSVNIKALNFREKSNSSMYIVNVGNDVIGQDSRQTNSSA